MSLRGKRNIISYQMTSQRRFMNTSWLSLLVAASFASLYHRITGLHRLVLLIVVYRKFTLKKS